VPPCSPLDFNRNYTDWDVPLTSSSLQSAPVPPSKPEPPSPVPAAYVVLRYKPDSKLAAYLHAAAGCPTKSSFIQAIQNGNFTSWPGLTADLISKHLLPTIATAKGHIRQEPKNLRSTKLQTPSPLPVPIKVEPEDTVLQESRTQECYLSVETKTTGTTYSDLCGRYPIKSSRGNQYIVVCYDYDTNSISTAVTKSRKGYEIRDVTIRMLDKLTQSGHPPQLHILDNEASDMLKQTLSKHKIAYQLVPPHLHRRNAAERAIQTFKNHFITTLCIADPNFPAKEWDRLLPQAELTLNLLRNCRFNPKLSAYAALHGTFDFNRTPIAPPGTKVLIHEKPDNRLSWAPRGTDAWYIGPAMEHYRCVHCYMPDTHSTRIADTVEYFPHQVPIPTHTTEDLIRDAVSDIIATLNNTHPAPPLLVPLQDNTRHALREIATLLDRAVPSPPPVEPIPVSPPRVQDYPPATAPPRVPVPSQPVASPRVPVSSPPPVAPPRVRPSSTNTTQHRFRKFPQPASREQMYFNLPLPKGLPSFPPPKVSRPVRARLDPHRHDPRHTHSRSTALAQLMATEYEAARDAHLNHIYHPVTGTKESYDSLRSQNPDRWETSFSNEIGRLAQGVGDRMKSGNENIFFIPRRQVPHGRKVTYANPVCDYRPLKSDQYRVRLTVGGDRLPYASDAGAPAASLLEAKILFNSVISTPGARFAAADIKDYFLCSPMDVYEYIKIPFRWFPEEIRLQYGLYALVEPDGYVYCEVRKGMYGLKQAARLAFDNLVKLLAPDGYYPVRAYPGLWKHKTRPTVFSLCVDDFGIKYMNMDDANHLMTSIRKHFKCTVDWTGKNYLGLTLDWNYIQRYVDLSMPGYVPRARLKFQHKMPKKPQYSPHPWQQPVYGQRIQYADDPSASPLLDKPGITRVQSINGTCIYYGRAVDPTILPAVNEISTQQAAPTIHTMELCEQLLDYLATYPNATIRFHASDMIAICETDAAYLVLPKARSRIAGHYYFTNRMDDYSKGSPTPNGPFHTECKALRRVVSSAAESETGGAFENAQHLIPIKYICEKIFNHPQPKDGSPLITDNSTSHGIATRLIKPRRSKTWDMRNHWLEDRIAQKEIQFLWKPGKTNRGDYFTKHHSPSHHRMMRPRYLVNAVVDTFFRHVSCPTSLPARVC
jgi:hypothetical protein